MRFSRFAAARANGQHGGMVDHDEFESIDLPGAELRFAPAWLSPADADALFAALSAEIAWETHRIRMFGRAIDSPRLSCWIGDPGAVYTYSRTRFEPRPWPPAIVPVRRRLAQTLGVDFDSVLANLYRDGRDSMGWHSDDEPELGPAPVIASLSLGGTRRFLFKPKPAAVPAQGNDGPAGDRRRGLALSHGSLLVMSGQTQANYLHALPATAKPVAARINLTFRRVGRLDA
jgi:alkylated DNA repair dioxygenase AlkB